MNEIEELKDNLQQVKQSIKLIDSKIELLEKEKEDTKKKEVTTYAIGDIVKNTFNTICMLVQPHADVVVLINLATGNRYYDSFYTNVDNVDNISEEEFNYICSDKGDCWSKVEFRFNWE